MTGPGLFRDVCERAGGQEAGSGVRRRVAPVSPTSSELPRTLRWAVWLLAFEAVAMGGVVVFLIYKDLTGEAAGLGAALAVTGFAAVIGATLAGLAVALSRGKARARAPAIVLQLLAVMFAYLLITAGLFWLGIPVAVLGVAVTTLLVAPPTTAVLD